MLAEQWICQSCSLDDSPEGETWWIGPVREFNSYLSRRQACVRTTLEVPWAGNRLIDQQSIKLHCCRIWAMMNWNWFLWELFAKVSLQKEKLNLYFMFFNFICTLKSFYWLYVYQVNKNHQDSLNDLFLNCLHYRDARVVAEKYLHTYALLCICTCMYV